MRRETRVNLKSSCQKALVKTRSRSETIDSVQLVYVIKKDPSNAGSCKGMRKSDEVAILCELVDDYKDTRVALRLGEPFDEIE